ncbi:MAG: SDR family oxidoreductase [Deltaproteobacteria bacterium]|nr:SDR family oxidoreductase [Deltaproteobacteria bacterium]
MDRLKGRVAIVTGAGQGIGAGVARALAAEGAAVVIANRTAETGREVAAGIERDFGATGAKALFVATDVANEKSVRATVETTVAELGGVDILVNNAVPTGGDGGGTRLENLSLEKIEEHVRVNYYGTFWGMQAVFPHMRKQQWGRIITMCSLNGVNAHRHTATYNSSKEAARALTRTAAVEWAKHGITCNVICPFAATPSWDRLVEFVPESAASILSFNPMGRPGDSEADVGPLAAFLASDESRYITGNTIHADGGGHINGVPFSFELPD